MNTDTRKEAIDALKEFEAAICILRTDAYFDSDGVNEAISNHDGNNVPAQHLLLALNSLQNAAIHTRLAILTLEEEEGA